VTRVNAETWTHHHANANGIRIHYVEQGEGFPVILLHGFPELWYSWRYQIPALAAVGLRVIAPDLRGYGGTDKPHEIEAYDIEHLAGDLTGLMDALDIEKAVVAGHDWGGLIMWPAVLMAPKRFERVIGVNTPALPRPPIPPISLIKASNSPRVQYIVFFQEEGRAEQFFESNLPRSIRRFYGGITAQTDFLSDEDLQVYVDAFSAGGMRGPLNSYRNMDRNWGLTANLDGKLITQPSLMVMAENDPVLTPALAEGMETRVPNLRKMLIRDCGHWTQQEKPEELNRILLDFLQDLAQGGAIA